jgi:antitoxin component YwqK of YwqJK toxin-antitoxin module
MKCYYCKTELIRDFLGFWCPNEKCGSIDGIVENFNGIKFWYKNGELHRDDGPTIEYPSGRKAWYKNGQLHRENGPAIECSDGRKYWYKNGKLQKYWINGKRVK